MKKSLLILSLVAFVFASCKKDQTCECCFDLLGVNTCSSTTAKMTKKDAETWCEGNTQGVSGVTCKLK
ncbi:MAG: hypothetical protein ACKOW8_09455 [Flavobacteriales bacterium]